MSNAKTFQDWAKEILPVVQAAANGEVIQGRFSGDCSDWEDSQHDWEVLRMTCEYRVKPKTIRIGEYAVPEPMRERPLNGECVYIVCTDRAFPVQVQWYPSEYSLYLLDSGLLHRERACAALHLKALLSLAKVGV